MFTWQFWLIVSGIFFIAEMITVGFLVFWLGVGALVTMLFSLFIANPIVQVAIFVISSALLIFFTKPLANKFLNKDNVETNVYSIIGKQGIVTKEINPKLATGQIKVDGQVWSAKCEPYESETIPENSEVEIIRVDGVKAVVNLVHIAHQEEIH